MESKKGGTFGYLDPEKAIEKILGTKNIDELGDSKSDLTRKWLHKLINYCGNLQKRTIRNLNKLEV